MRQDSGRSCNRGERERQRCGASAPAWWIWRRWRERVDGRVLGRSGHRPPEPSLLRERCQFTAARLPDGRIVCAGGLVFDDTRLSWVEVCEPPTLGAIDAAWTWRELSEMSVARSGYKGCVMSDGRFAVLGGIDGNNEPLSSCEALVVGHDEHWDVLPPMHEARSRFACAAVAGCIIVAGGYSRTPNGDAWLRSAAAIDEVLGRWLRLPCDVPYYTGLMGLGSALL